MRISVDSAEQQGNNASGYPNISSNGRYVVFDSDASVESHKLVSLS
jgi:hypothetical protein